MRREYKKPQEIEEPSFLSYYPFNGTKTDMVTGITNSATSFMNDPEDNTRQVLYFSGSNNYDPITIPALLNIFSNSTFCLFTNSTYNEANTANMAKRNGGFRFEFMFYLLGQQGQQRLFTSCNSNNTQYKGINAIVNVSGTNAQLRVAFQTYNEMTTTGGVPVLDYTIETNRWYRLVADIYENPNNTAQRKAQSKLFDNNNELLVSSSIVEQNTWPAVLGIAYVLMLGGWNYEFITACFKELKTYQAMDLNDFMM